MPTIMRKFCAIIFCFLLATTSFAALNWQVMNQGFVTKNPRISALSLKTKANLLYAATAAHLYRTNVEKINWQSIDDNVFAGNKVLMIEQNPIKQNELYVSVMFQ